MNNFWNTTFAIGEKKSKTNTHFSLQYIFEKCDKALEHDFIKVAISPLTYLFLNYTPFIQHNIFFYTFTLTAEIWEYFQYLLLFTYLLSPLPSKAALDKLTSSQIEIERQQVANFETTTKCITLDLFKIAYISEKLN